MARGWGRDAREGDAGEDVPRSLRKEPEFTLPIRQARDGEIGTPLVTKEE